MSTSLTAVAVLFDHEGVASHWPMPYITDYGTSTFEFIGLRKGDSSPSYTPPWSKASFTFLALLVHRTVDYTVGVFYICIRQVAPSLHEWFQVDKLLTAMSVNCSGLLYLNDDFEGGDFYFTTENLSTQVGVTHDCESVTLFCNWSSLCITLSFVPCCSVLNVNSCCEFMWLKLDAVHSVNYWVNVLCKQWLSESLQLVFGTVCNLMSLCRHCCPSSSDGWRRHCSFVHSMCDWTVWEL